MDASAWAVQVLLHCVSVEPGHADCPAAYRGLDRYWHLSEAIGQIAYEDPELLPLYQETLDRVWEHYDDTPLRGSKIHPIPSDLQFTQQMLRFFALMPWDRVPAYIARNYELIASVETPAAMDADDVVATVRDTLGENELLRSWPLEFLGFDIIEWPSNWSVPGNLSYWSHGRWTRSLLNSNDCYLCLDWQSNERLWQIYQGAGDPDCQPEHVYMYHRIGIVGVGAVDSARGTLQAI